MLAVFSKALHLPVLPAMPRTTVTEVNTAPTARPVTPLLPGNPPLLIIISQPSNSPGHMSTLLVQVVISMVFLLGRPHPVTPVIRARIRMQAKLEQIAKAVTPPPPGNLSRSLIPSS